MPRPANAQLTLPPGFAIDVFAEGGFKTLRWAMEGPGGEVFVTDTTANTITVLRDADKDGKAETRAVFAQGLDRPMGMAIHDGWFYVGNTDAIAALAVHARPGLAHRHARRSSRKCPAAATTGRARWPSAPTARSST